MRDDAGAIACFKAEVSLARSGIDNCCLVLGIPLLVPLFSWLLYVV
jgi:hypothetical protein